MSDSRADLWSTSAARTPQPVHDLAATLVHSARSSDVRTAIVDGRVLMATGSCRYSGPRPRNLG